jgi:hypothetical protein
MNLAFQERVRLTLSFEGHLDVAAFEGFAE